MQSQGSRLLQVIGILMIIGGGIVLITSLIALAGIGALGAMAGSGAAGVALGIIAVGASLVAGAIELIAGILGVKNWRQPAKAKSCIVMGIIIIVLQALSFIMALVGGTPDYLSVVLGLVLPILYLVGAFQLKNMAA